MQGFGTRWSLWCIQAWNICLAIMNQVAFPASELLQLSRPPCDGTEWWFMGLLANGLLRRHRAPYDVSASGLFGVPFWQYQSQINNPMNGEFPWTTVSWQRSSAGYTCSSFTTSPVVTVLWPWDPNTKGKLAVNPVTVINRGLFVTEIGNWMASQGHLGSR